MNLEEILLRVGVDARGVATGMGRITSFVKGQMTALVDDLQGMAGRWLGVLGVEKMFESIKDRVSGIKEAMQTTGLSAELVQGIFNKISEEGGAPEKIIRPLAQLTGLTGDSKKFLEDLADAYVHLNTQEERNAMLMNLGIKNWQALIPVLEEGRKGIEEMSAPSNFKLTKQEVTDLTMLWEGTKGGFNAILSQVSSFGAAFAAIPKNIAILLTHLQTGESMDVIRKRAENVLEGERIKKLEAQAEAQGFTLAEKRAEMEDAINKLMQQRAHLQQNIADRDKLTINELAERARVLTGTDKMPRGLATIYSLTPAMSAALQVQDLEDRAKVAQAMGQSGEADRFQSQADAIRAQTPALKSTERYPIERTQEQIENMSKQIDVIAGKVKLFPHIP